MMLALPNPSPSALVPPVSPSPLSAPLEATAPTSTSVLLCSLDDTLLGLDALVVSEIVPLPAIAPVAEKPPGVQGVINLRGHIVPVLDARLLLGFEPRPPRPSDRLVVLEYQGQLAALPVDEVHDVQSLDAATIEPGRAGSVVAGIGHVGDAIVQLLRLPTVLLLSRLPNDARLETEIDAAEFSGLALAPHWKSAPEDAALFRERAAALARPLDSDGELVGAQFRHLAAVKLGGEYFGLDLRFVREFAPLQLLTPVPCSPAFVLGLVNLRGEILTLVDARPALGLSAFDATSLTRSATTEAPGAQIVVVEDGATRLGLAVDEVIDVFTVKDAVFAPAPSAAREEGELIDGTVSYHTMRLSVLDLSKLISGLLAQSEVAASDSNW